MKHYIFKYVAIAAALLATAVNAGAQYNIKGGVGTSKQVTGPDASGNYTIRLETFATGSTTVTESYIPADIALVLDLSTSMNVSRGSTTRVTAQTALSYNSVFNARTTGTNYLYYGYGRDNYDLNYFQLFGEIYNDRYYLYINQTGGSNNHRYIRVRNNGRIELTTNRDNATFATSPDGTIVTFPGGNNSVLYTGSSRIFALKEAICTFIDTINEKDFKEDGTRIGHKLSIISFESDVNVHQELASLESLDLNELKEKVWAFSLRTGTQPSEGIDEANTQFSTNGHSGTVGTDFARTVVVFTDGDPYENPKYLGIRSANTSKNTYKASVYTVGMFNNSPAPNSDLWRFMNYMSSNYPNATVDDDNTMTPGNGSDQGFYKDASSSTVDLSEIFKAIAEGAGSAEATIGTSTQVRDVVTNSFVLPNDVSTADVHVYTSAATGSATGADDTNPEGWATPVEITSSLTGKIKIVDVDANGNPTTNTNEKKNKALFIEGFEYSKDDSAEGAGDGNWVGPRFKNNSWFWAGKKLIITFKVKADGEATGGESQTNTGKSGVYVLNEDGKTYTCINNYEQPHTTLTVNIKIKKTGLRSGESATFELMRIRPKGYNPNGATTADKIANIEFNLIGKPKPGTHESTDPSLKPTDSDPSKYYASLGWESFKKVILTNMSDANGAEVEKDVLALDPYWVYMVVEDDWGWAYTMTGDANQVGEDGTYTTSSVEVNPFRFHNTEKSGVVKHAEAVMINHFQSKETGATSYTEHKKSSKLQSFNQTNN